MGVVIRYITLLNTRGIFSATPAAPVELAVSSLPLTSRPAPVYRWETIAAASREGGTLLDVASSFAAIDVLLERM